MKNINIVLNSQLNANDTYTKIADFSQYEQLCSSVKKIDVEKVSDNTSLSTWQVEFHDGEMHWVEKDTFSVEKRLIEFVQVDGDAEHFSGRWQIIENSDGVQVCFDAQFSLGIPSLADILEPIAEKAIRHNINEMVKAILINEAI